jgi:hypothetical protein
MDAGSPESPPSPRRAHANGAAMMRPHSSGKAGDASSEPEKLRLGLLARYSRWSHDRPCTVFSAVTLFILIITAIVGAANLASFTSDYGDKVRLARRHHLERTHAP